MKMQEMVLEDGTTLLLIHFLFQSPRGVLQITGRPLLPSEFTWKIACTPNLMEFGADRSRECPWMRSDDPRAVTCPLCKATEIFQQRLQEETVNARKAKR